MPDAVRRASAFKSAVRASSMSSLSRKTEQSNHARVTIGMAKLVYNFKRLVFWQRLGRLTRRGTGALLPEPSALISARSSLVKITRKRR